MTSPNIRKLAIMFADIRGSTRLYETLGDTVAQRLIDLCLRSMAEVIERHQGWVVKTIGDEIMAALESADQGISAAIEIQEVISEDVPLMSEDAPDDLAVRIGVHFGETLIENDDCFGDAVNVAARMASVAKGEEIITTQDTVDTLSGMLRASARFLDRLPIKGKSEPIAIYELIWRTDDVTHMRSVAPPLTASGSLHLRYCGEERVLNEEHSSIGIGRSRRSQLVLNSQFASRDHARLEYRRGKFLLQDHSTNGTYVVADGTSTFLRRDEISLPTTGQIIIGIQPGEHSDADQIDFLVRAEES